MTIPGERRLTPERRLILDRRTSVERPYPTAAERRRADDRRSGVERRLPIESAGDQIRGALRLMTRVVEAGALTEQVQRSLEAAMLRLRFALDRLEES